MKRHIRLTMSVVIPIILIGGCAGERIGEARRLSASGADASGKMLTAANKVSNGFEAATAQDVFLNSLQGSTIIEGDSCSLIGQTRPRPGFKPTRPPADAVTKIQASLDARVALAAALVKTYAAFGALAQYDASAEVSAGVSDLFGAANKLRAVWSLNPISDTVGKIATAGGGFLGQQAQLSKLHAASQEVRAGLEGYLEALKESETPITSVMSNTIGEQYSLTLALWQRGMLSAAPLVENVGQSAQLGVVTSEKIPLTAANEGLCNGVRSYLEARRDDARGSVSADVMAQIQLIESLIAAHVAFEQESKIDTASIRAFSDQVISVAKSLGSPS